MHCSTSAGAGESTDGTCVRVEEDAGVRHQDDRAHLDCNIIVGFLNTIYDCLTTTRATKEEDASMCNQDDQAHLESRIIRCLCLWIDGTSLD